MPDNNRPPDCVIIAAAVTSRNSNTHSLEISMQDLRIKTNEIELAVRDCPCEGEAIVFLHFCTGNLMMWQPILPNFQDRYRLILVDLRGHGKSDKPESGYHIDDMAADVVGVMRQLNVTRAHLVGSSLGAEVALSIAANYPEMTLSLVCEGAFVSEYGPYGVWQGSREEFDAHVAEKLDQIRQRPVNSFPTVDALVKSRQELLEQYGAWNADFEAMERYDASITTEGEFTRALGKQNLENYMAYYFETRFEDYYPRVQCPILALPAEEEINTEVFKRTMDKMMKLAKDVKVAPIQGWEHAFGWLLNPQEASKVVLGFLEKIVN